MRWIFANAVSAVTEVTLALNLPLDEDIIPTIAASNSPGAYTKLLLTLNHDQDSNSSMPIVYGIQPGYENVASALTTAKTADWDTVTAAQVTHTTLPLTTHGLVIDCYGFKGAGGELPTVEEIDQVQCVGEFAGVGYIQTLALSAP